MKLSEMEGIGPATQRKLRGAGVRSVKDLATLNTRDVRVDGIGLDRLQGMKKQAQMALYKAAAAKVVTSTKRTGKAALDTVRDVEARVRQAAKEALEAAWEAEHRAIEALRARTNGAEDMADSAAARAREAQRVAQEKARYVLEQLAWAPEAARGAWERYGELAKDAERKAVDAAGRAAGAAKRAGGFVGRKAVEIGTQSKSFLARLKAQKAASNGDSGA